ncbi:SAM-dependent methyltransferase [Psychroserpens sp.]|uniref:SAM-dependent methyltransferase n=1 Tax=Psychroserpens sp. TaxID=2020870 RepID=UPI003C7183C9
MLELDASYWDKRYQTNDIGWDLGEISPPLKNYIDQLTDKTLRILVPGGGHSYEAEYLFENDFKNVYVIDIAQTALSQFKARVVKFPSEQLLHQDFFKLNMTFDLILEQTFFCALQPSLRVSYVDKMNDLLSQNGKLVGVLFNRLFSLDHPPFGAIRQDYLELFQGKFRVNILETCYNSASERSGMELFFSLSKL